ncbi:MAG: SDR family NAD(P)-dependent oxidoreductase [Pseudomonadota bacterium]
MSKTILLTGATDGIGLETAKLLIADGHRLLAHGRNAGKLDALKETLAEGPGTVETYQADLSNLQETDRLAAEVAAAHDHLDVIINNAGVFRTPSEVTADGHDVRFVVNTIAPYMLTRRLLDRMDKSGRIVNLSSAAQSPVSLEALAGQKRLEAMEAYSQSKLAITIWSQDLARELGSDGPAVIAVNPGSLLASKMVRDGFGVAGSDLGIGARVLVDAALGDRFAGASGQYFDNDSGAFANPHPFAMDAKQAAGVMQTLDALLP